jgi:CrcB protein
MEILAIAIGGALGALGRFGISKMSSFSIWATFAVNFIGCSLIVIFFHLYKEDILRQKFWVTGFLGAFTTFSTFSLEAIILVQEGRFIYSFFFVLMNLLGCLSGTWLTYRLVNY